MPKPFKEIIHLSNYSKLNRSTFKSMISMAALSYTESVINISIVKFTFAPSVYKSMPETNYSFILCV